MTAVDIASNDAPIDAPAIDAPAIDVVAVVDAPVDLPDALDAGADAGAPEASVVDVTTVTVCHSDRECTATGRVCDRARAQWVACNTNADCAGGGVCLGDRCAARVPCTASRMCPGRICDATGGFCVECLTNIDCPSGTACRNGGCVAPPRACRSTRECTDVGLVCDAARGVCAECVADADCGPGNVCGPGNLCAATVCTPDARACVSPSRVRVCDARGLSESQQDCAAGTVCVTGLCMMQRCTPGQVSCASDTARQTCNPDGLGATATACASGERCVEGRCVMRVCTPGEATCASGVVRRVCNADGLAYTSMSCPDPSGAAGSCDAGRCSFTCIATFGDCDGNAANGCEATLNTVTHCLRCGAACPSRPNSTPTCGASGCAITCAAGYADCNGDAADGCEVDVNADASHCGACGRRCAAGGSCRGGVCATAAWYRAFTSGEGTGAVRGVAVDASGNVYVAGFFRVALDINGMTVPAVGESDGFIASFTPDGAYRWHTVLGTLGSDALSAVAISASGLVCVGGSFSGSMRLTTFVTLSSAGGTDGIVGCLNSASGAWSWGRGIGSPLDDSIRFIAATGTNVVALGEFQGTVASPGIAFTSAGARDVLVASYSEYGAINTARQFGSSMTESTAGIAADPRGGCALTVVFNGPMAVGATTFTPRGTSGSSDAVVIDLDASLTPRWATQLGSTASDLFYSTATDPSGNVYFTGYAYGPLTIGPDAMPGGGGFVASLGATGAPRWSRSFGSGIPIGLTTTDDGRVFVTGQGTSSSISLGSFTVTSSASSFGFVAELAADGAPQALRGSMGTMQSLFQSVAASRTNVVLGGWYRGAYTIEGLSPPASSNDAALVVNTPR